MNGRIAKKIRMVAIGNHKMVVNERSSRTYKFLKPTSTRLSIMGGHSGIICDGVRRLYQQTKEDYKNNGDPKEVKARRISKFCEAYKKFLVSSGPDFEFLAKQRGQITDDIKSRILG